MARCNVLHFKRVVQGGDDFLDVRITGVAAATMLSMPGCEKPTTIAMPSGVLMASDSSCSSATPEARRSIRKPALQHAPGSCTALDTSHSQSKRIARPFYSTSICCALHGLLSNRNEAPIGSRSLCCQEGRLSPSFHMGIEYTRLNMTRAFDLDKDSVQPSFGESVGK